MFYKDNFHIYIIYVMSGQGAVYFKEEMDYIFTLLDYIFIKVL